MFQTIVKMFIFVGLIIISAGRRKNCRFSYPDKIDLLFSSLQIVVKLSNLKLKNRLHLCYVRSQWINSIYLSKSVYLSYAHKPCFILSFLNRRNQYNRYTIRSITYGISYKRLYSKYTRFM